MAIETSEVFVEGNSVLNILVSLLIITPEIQLRLEEEHAGRKSRASKGVNEVQVNASEAPKASHSPGLRTAPRPARAPAGLLGKAPLAALPCGSLLEHSYVLRTSAP